RDQLERQAERRRPAGLPRKLLHPLGRRGEPQRTHLAPARLEADLVAEGAVELDRAHHHLRQAERPAQLADEPSGVERRAARQLGALDEHDVLRAQPGQPVEDRAAADAAADHDHACAVSHSGVTYPAVKPPSTRNVAPFTYDDSSLARKSAAFTISRGLASRPVGQWIRRRSSAAGLSPKMLSRSGVSTGPGQSAFTLICSRANCTASSLDIESTAPFDAV